MKTNKLEQRTELVQDVIDRHVKYEDEYLTALKEFNAKFPIIVEYVKGSRTYKTIEKTTTIIILLIVPIGSVTHIFI
jgi:hypothetical protein